MSKREHERLTADHADDWRDRMPTEVPRQHMSELFERRTKKTWIWLREMLEERQRSEGGLSEMNRETLKRAIINCEEG